MPLPDGPRKKLAAEVSALVHAGKKRDAAAQVADFCKIKVRLLDEDPKKTDIILTSYLHNLLDSGAPEEAAELLWTPTQFTPRPQFTKDLWTLFDTASLGLVMGAASCSKSFGLGVRFFLEFVRDPMWTTIKVLGPSEDHLESNLFSHLVGLHKSASLPMPGEVGELFIGLDRRNQISSIKGLVIPIGKSKKAGRLQGAKRKPRPNPHPIFGPLSRLFILIDEFENLPGGIYSDLDNIISNADETGVSGFKVMGSYNPTNRGDEVAKRAEPVFGWENFNPEIHFRWKSIRGWDVLRLDGEKSENVVQNKVVYPGLQTRAGLEAIARNAGGLNSAGYYSMGRGAYPPQGVSISIIPAGMLQKMRGEFIWLEAPKPVGSVDLALQGGAAAIYTLGKWGRATGMKLPPTMDHPNGIRVMFKDAEGRALTRWGLQADQQFTIPKGDTVAMKDSIIKINKGAGVRPEFFACDRTGAGQGVADLIRFEWSPSIHDINYSRSPSVGKLMEEDSKTCEEEYDRIHSELWFAMRAYGEFGYLLIHPSVSMEKLTLQITQRFAKPLGVKKSIESKKDYISRGHPSPDDADSLTLFVLAARRGSGVVLSMLGNDPDKGSGPDGWEDEGSLIGGTRVDPSSRTDYLNEAAIL